MTPAEEIERLRAAIAAHRAAWDGVSFFDFPPSGANEALWDALDEPS